MPLRFLLGVFASAAAGGLIGSELGLAGRQLVFPVVLAAAAWVLVFLLRADARQPERAAQPEAARVQPTAPALNAPPARPALSAGKAKKDLAGELLAADRPLTPDEARAWLDDFLVQQQS